MRLRDVAELLQCRVIHGENQLDQSISAGCGADLMSDVLASGGFGGVLLTGLINKQVINTAVIADITAVVYVRGKRPLPDAVELARENSVTLLSTDCSMFEACGKLYKGGLPSYRELRQAGQTSAMKD